jgi:hypothetical protein
MMNLVIRFISEDKKICHRLAALKMLKQSLTGVQLFGWIVATLCGDLGIKSDRIGCLIRDGCSVNTKAAELLQQLNPLALDIICLSHSANVAGKQLNDEVPVATKFISRWAQLVSHCRLARLKFLEKSTVSVVRLARVRWFSFCEVAIQIHQYWSAVLDVIHEDNDFAVEGRAALRLMINQNPILLRLEIALIADVGKPLINFCYFREGDGFLSPTTYQHWRSMVKEVEDITAINGPLCPCVEDILDEVFVGSPGDRLSLREASVAKGRKVIQKLNQDESSRLLVTLGIMRACRFFDYSFVANCPLITLLEEMIYLHRIPVCIEKIDQLRVELPTYQSLAKAEDEKENRMDLWPFWVANMLNIPSWFSASEDIALIQPSSGCSERVFAMTTNLFDETKSSALEDRKEGTVMIRMNQNWRLSEINQLN